MPARRGPFSSAHARRLPRARPGAGGAALRPRSWAIPSICWRFRVALLLMALNCLFYFLQNQCRWEFRTAEFVLISLVYAFLHARPFPRPGNGDRPASCSASSSARSSARPSRSALAPSASGAASSFASTPRSCGSCCPTRSRWCRRASPCSSVVYASRIILNALASLDDVGLYTLAVQIGGIATLGIVGIQAALTPPGHGAIITSRRRRDSLRACSRSTIGSSPSSPASLLGLFAPELIHYVGNHGLCAGGAARADPRAGACFIAQLYVFAPGFAVAKRTRTGRCGYRSRSALARHRSPIFWLIPAWCGITGAADRHPCLVDRPSCSLWFLSQPAPLSDSGALGPGRRRLRGRRPARRRRPRPCLREPR